MTKDNFTTEHLKGQHLNFAQRLILEKDLRDKKSNRKCAKDLNCSPTTIASERKRGEEPYLMRDGRTVRLKPYSAKMAQASYERHREDCHKIEFFQKFPQVKIRLLEWLKPAKGKKRISIEVALFLLSKEFEELPCVKTVYYDMLHGKLGSKAMDWLVGYRKHKKHEVPDYKKHLGKPITARPEAANLRQEFGHWEVDLVLGKREKGEVLLTLLERTTNFYIVRRCVNKCADTINQTLKEIFKEFGKKNFKTLTSDNGSEFSSLHRLRGVKAYFCHPYCSWEKGANERHNRMLREFILKGTKLVSYSYYDILRAQHEINRCPRKSKGFKTPEELFYKMTT